jgi:hypothetical protein
LDELETSMRDVLVRLALTSNGRTVSYDSSGGGEPDYVLVDDRGRGKLDRGDAPHLYYAALWHGAGADAGRRAEVLELAKDELDSILKSRANRHLAGESKSDRDRRIVEEGEGFPARDVANAIRCGIKDVWRAREAACRDVEWGQRRRDGNSLTRLELKSEIWRMHAMKMNDRQIAAALNIARGSVRFVLARPA